MTPVTRPFIVGLTGGIGSGKSTAAKIFSDLGAAIVDVDQIAHELTAPAGAAMAEIRAAFGAESVDDKGALDRAAMRRLVFTNPAARERLEAILHPAIRCEADKRCSAPGTAPYVLLVVPLLIESADYRQRCDRVVVVDSSEANQIARVCARPGMTEEDVKRIMAAQVGRAERLAAADDIIQNDGDLDALRAQVESLNHKYLALKSIKHSSC
jgi:dephospho-CoA kinase